MEDVPYHRAYRFSGNWGWLVSGLALSGLAAVGLVVRMSLDDWVPAFVSVLVGLGFAAFFGFLVYLVTVSATLVDEKQVTVRTAFRRRSVPWSRVQGIEIQDNPGAGQAAPQLVTVLYDADGKRYFLPHLHDRAPLDLEEEVAELRQAWRERRGPGWTAVPEVADRIDRIRQGESSPWLNGALGAAAGFLIGIVAFVVALNTGVYDYDADNPPLVETLTEPLSLTVGLPLTFGLLSLVGTVLYRRRRRA